MLLVKAPMAGVAHGLGGRHAPYFALAMVNPDIKSGSHGRFTLSGTRDCPDFGYRH